MKILLDSERDAPKGWLVIRDFEGFGLLLTTIKFEDIEVVDFDWELDETNIFGLNGGDAAHLLIETAHGRKLPMCITHAPKEQALKLAEILDHYTASYKYDNLCQIITRKKLV